MEDVCTTSITDAARLVQLLKIDGYCATNNIGSSSSYSIESRWNVDGYDWEICIYLDLQWSVALELIFRSRSRTNNYVRANLGCRLVDLKGILTPSEQKTVSGEFMYDSHHSSKLMLMKRCDLEASGYLTDDALTLECTITVLKELPVQTFPVKQIPMPAVPSSNLHEHFGELLQSEKGVDVTFLVSGQTFVAHKAVLAARSPVFMAQFYGQMMEKRSHRVEVKDMEAAVFKTLLRFIYTDTAPDFSQQEEEVITMAQHLLAAADRYGLDRLKLICAGRLAGGNDVNTVATTLALAEQHNCSELKSRWVMFIVKTPAVLDAVLKTEGYKHLLASCPSVTDLFVRGRKKTKRK
ncbi:BTB/POZ and MATH domain-containing protein 1-like [Triticum dicoccoides]|uniref:BTB/POZ and MATH domain-containing protein 1-like n=1 Tax=Triticum dicoccoides TaxID=85692 RepID=UPI00188E8B0D|nr:BTB/POZ and MATH domain-containing protein 1-like [Triticum dicoccoides]